MRQLLPVAAVLAVTASGSAAQSSPPLSTGTISGRVTVIDNGDKSADDVSQAVLWLETDAPVIVRPETVTVNTSKKEFQPHVAVVPVGSHVEFPNSDPFDHNVFSLSDNAMFDLGTFGRGESRGTTFDRPGIIRIFCNVHANMSGTIVVRDNPYFAQPLADGSFSIPAVPVGTYTMRVWHERARETATLEVEVTRSGLSGLAIELDARGYVFVQHLNKFGRPYSTARRGRRY
jgi:plastocyanin